jgi:hypothetical protein
MAIDMPAPGVRTYLAAAGCGAVYVRSASRGRLLLGATADLGAVCGKRLPKTASARLERKAIPPGGNAPIEGGGSSQLNQVSFA